MILLAVIFLTTYKPKNIDRYYYLAMFELLLDALFIVYLVGSVVIFGA